MDKRPRHRTGCRRPVLDVHDVKQRDQRGPNNVHGGVAAAAGSRTHAVVRKRARQAKLVFAIGFAGRAVPPAVFGGGCRPAAGQSGLRLDPGWGRVPTHKCPVARTTGRSLGRMSDQAAVNATMSVPRRRIGFLEVAAGARRTSGRLRMDMISLRRKVKLNFVKSR